MSGQGAPCHASGPPDQAKGPHVRQRGHCVRQRDPMSVQGAPDQAKGRGPISGKEGPVSGQGSPIFRPRKPPDQPKGLHFRQRGHRVRPHKAPCLAKGGLRSDHGPLFLVNGGPQIRPVHFQAKRAPCQAEAKGSSSQATPRGAPWPDSGPP